MMTGNYPVPGVELEKPMRWEEIPLTAILRKVYTVVV